MFVQASSYDGQGREKPLPLDLFEVSAFHQIHCLVSKASFYGTFPFWNELSTSALLTLVFVSRLQSAILEDYGNLAQGKAVPQLPGSMKLEHLTWAEHSAHCFNYVFDAIRCFADSTAEGGSPGEPTVVHRTAAHVCNDFDALLAWSRQPEQQMPDSVRPVD